MSRSAQLITRLARSVAGEAAPKERVSGLRAIQVPLPLSLRDCSPSRAGRV
jgi:hypothetical protein